MRYSFFGTCVNDYDHLINCIDTIVAQSILPKQIILVNSGSKNIKKLIQSKLINKNIDFIYIQKSLIRENALNLALKNCNSELSFRFDVRTRFSIDYAKNVMSKFNDQKIKASVIGGVPLAISNDESIQAKLCKEIMNRSYIFFYPKHRNRLFNGYSSSVYLGCFKTKLLKKFNYREVNNLISEDSLIINDFLKEGYKTYLDSSIKLSYVSRSKFKNILFMFHSYGFARANTILSQKKLFISPRHSMVFVFGVLLVLLLLVIKLDFYLVLLLPFLLILINLLGEIFEGQNKTKLIIPFFATLCQFLWILGFIWGILLFIRKIIK